MDDVIRTRGLERRFGGRAAVAGVDLAVPAGSCFGLLGPNGAGKTTLIRLLLGLLEPTGGEAWLLGLRQPRGRRAALARVGAVVEEPRFHDHLTARENLRVHAVAREAAAALRIAPALARVGLAARADDRVRRLSLGMRQRLAIARCLLADPALLILDEPLNGLDPAGVLELRGLLADLVAEGRTVLVSSHQLAEVERICDRVAILDRGRVVAQGPTALLAAGDEALDVTCDDAGRAAAALAGTPLAAAVDRDGDRLRIRLGVGARAADVVRALVGAGVGVERVAPAHATLEERFLALTSTLGGAS